MVETLRSSIDVLNLQLTVTLELLVGRFSILFIIMVNKDISTTSLHMINKRLICLVPVNQRVTKTNSIMIYT